MARCAARRQMSVVARHQVEWVEEVRFIAARRSQDRMARLVRIDRSPAAIEQVAIIRAGSKVRGLCIGYFSRIEIANRVLRQRGPYRNVGMWALRTVRFRREVERLVTK